MAVGLRKGDRVSWKAGQGRANGTVERVIVGAATVKGRKVNASPDDPRYVVKNEKTGTSTVKQGDSLRQLKKPAEKPTAAAAKAPPKPAGTAPSPPGRATRGGNRPLLIAGGVLAVLAVIALAFVLIDGGGSGEDEGDVEAAALALERTDQAMQAVFDTFESDSLRTVDEAQLPYGKFRDEVLRPAEEVEASFEAERKEYAAAIGAINNARAALDENEGGLTGAEDVADEAEIYVVDSRAFLDRYEDAIVHLQEALILDRQTEEGYIGGNTADDSVSAAREAVAAEVSRLEEIARRYEELQPPSDLEEIATATKALNGLQLAQQQELAEMIDGVGSEGAISRAEIEIETEPLVRRLRVELAALQKESVLALSIAELSAEADELARDLDEL